MDKLTIRGVLICIPFYIVLLWLLPGFDTTSDNGMALGMLLLLGSPIIIGSVVLQIVLIAHFIITTIVSIIKYFKGYKSAMYISNPIIIFLHILNIIGFVYSIKYFMPIFDVVYKPIIWAIIFHR